MPQVGAFIGGVVKGLASFFGYSGGATYVGSGASAAGAASAGTAVGSFLGSTFVAAGISAGVTSLTQKNLGAGGRAMAQALENIIDSMPPKRFVYGQTRVGATLVYAKALQTYDSDLLTQSKKNQCVHMVYEIAGHPCESIDQVYLEDTALNLVQATSRPDDYLFPDTGASWGVDSNGVSRYIPNGTVYDNWLMVKLYTGAQLTADQDLQDAMTANGIGTEWPDTCVGYGKTYVYLRALFKPNIFRGTPPQLSFDMHGKNDIYDPRDLSTGYTSNPILCTRDYLLTSREEGGYGVAAGSVNDAIAGAAATTCDELIQIFDDGTQQTRYFLGGMFTTAQQPQEIVKDMLETCAGWMEWVNGKWWLKAGEYSAPVMTLTESEFIGLPSWELCRDLGEIVNSVKPVLRSAETAWYPSNVKSIEALRKVWGSTSGDTFTCGGNHDLVVGDRIKFEWWTGTAVDNSLLPGSLTAEVYYYVVEVPTSTTFKVSGTAGGAALSFGTTSGELTALHDVYLSKDVDRRSIEQLFAMCNDETLSRRLGIITLRATRQEMSGVLPCKVGTPYACPFDLVKGETFRLILNHMSFWSPIESAVTITSDGSGFHSSHTSLVDADPLVFSALDAQGLQGFLTSHVYYVVNLSGSSGNYTFGLAEYRGGPAIDSDDFSQSLSHSGYKVQGKLFRVSEWDPVIDDGMLMVNLSVRDWAENIYDWTNDREIDPEDAPGITTNDIRQVEKPVNLDVETGTDVLFAQQDGTIISRARLTWDEPGDIYITEGGKVEIQYSATGANNWVDTPDLPGGTTEAFLLGLQDGAFYDFRVRFKNAFGFNSDWTLVGAVEMLGKTEPPNNVSNPAVDDYDENNLVARLSWEDPTDLDLQRIDIYYDVDEGSGYSGSLTFLASVLPGVQKFKHEGVYTNPDATAGNPSNWKWVFKTVDTSGNESDDEPWPEILDYPIPVIPGVTDFQATTRTAVNGGLQINNTWTDDESTSEVELQWWKHGIDDLKKNAQHTRTQMSKEAADVDITPFTLLDQDANGNYIDTLFWIRAWRVFLVNGQEVWSDAISIQVTVHPDNDAPPRVTAIDIDSFDPKTRSVIVSWNGSKAPDINGYIIYRKNAGGSTAKQAFTPENIIGTVTREANQFVDEGVIASGSTENFHYWVRAVDDKGNKATQGTVKGDDWDYIPVQAAPIPTVTSVQPAAGGGGIRVDWPANAAYEDDEMWIQWGKDGTTPAEIYDNTFPYGNDGAKGPTEAFLPVPEGKAGQYWVRLARVFKYDNRDIYSQFYNHGSLITTTEDTAAPSVPTNLTAAYNQLDTSVVLGWDPASEIDLSHYEIWYSHTGTLYQKIHTYSADKDSTDKPRWVHTPVYWSDPSGETHYYKIRSVDRAGNKSNFSTVKTVEVGPASAPDVSVSGYNQGPAIKCDWTGDSDFSDSDLAEHEVVAQWWPNITNGIQQQKREAIGKWNDGTSAKGIVYIPVDPQHPQIGVTNGFWIRFWRRSGPTHAPVWTDASSYQVTVPADAGAPGNPTGFGYTFDDQGAVLSWTNPQDIDLDHMEISRKYGADRKSVV